MNLNEFRQRWIKGEEPRAETSIDDSRIGRIDDWRPSPEQPEALQSIRLRPKYVPEANGAERTARFRQVAVRVLRTLLVFIAALIVLRAVFEYLPAYLTAYVFDR